MKQLNVLIACEFSGTVRDAFTKLGHIAVSCDLEPSDAPGLHYQGNKFMFFTKEIKQLKHFKIKLNSLFIYDGLTLRHYLLIYLANLGNEEV